MIGPVMSAGFKIMRFTRLSRRRWVTAMLLACFFLAASPRCGTAAEAYYISAYWAKHSPDRFMDILTRLSPEFERSYLVALAGGYVFHRWKGFRFELEGQGVLHTGMQHHPEINGLIAARWMDFPWDHWVDTRIAFGEGLSYAFRRPYLEPRRDPEEAESTRLLNYLMVEVEFVIPGMPQWSKFVRVHHRSGAAGLFGGVEGGSNFIGTGIRYMF